MYIFLGLLFQGSVFAGPNAISVSLSPLSNFVLVGLAAKRLAWVFTPKQVRHLMGKYCLKTLID